LAVSDEKVALLEAGGFCEVVRPGRLGRICSLAGFVAGGVFGARRSVCVLFWGLSVTGVVALLGLETGAPQLVQNFEFGFNVLPHF